MNYAKIYDNFIKTRSENIEEYYEVHHIMPRCLGGPDEKSNLIKLTAREYFLAHRLLAKIHPKKYWIAIRSV